jgi:glycerol-3-phosphate dehydrogenase (NAD(P)+)
MKGLEKNTGLRMSEVCSECGVEARSLSAWLGPGHPQELVSGVPTCMLVASSDEGDSGRISSVLGSSLIRFYRSQDLAGCEIGAAAKNVVGIAAGMLDGLGYSGLKGALMARAPQEVARVVAAAGGDWRSVYGLSHLGDYEATLFSRLSRNRALGEAIVKGGGQSGLAEGVETSAALELLADRLGVEVPITSAVRAVIRGDFTAAEAIEKLFGRPSREEFASFGTGGTAR